MAEIRVQPKPRSRAWLWLLLALAVVALVAWYLTSQGFVTVQQSARTSATPAGTHVGAAPAAATLARS